MTYLRFYLDRGCVVVPCQPGTKKLIKGAGAWTSDDSQANLEMLSGNSAMRNGTGGLLVVDIDAKHGGSIDLIAERFPNSTSTRMIQTVSPGEHGLGRQLIYSLPVGFDIRPTVLVRSDSGNPMIEVAAFAMLPGSRARGADGVMRTYELLSDVPPSPAPPELLAVVEARRTVRESESIDIGDDQMSTRSQLEMRLARIADAGEGQRNDVFTQNALPVVRLCAALGEDPEAVLEAAYDQSGGTDHRWLLAAVKSAISRAADEPAGRLELGPLAKERLIEMQNWARFAPWPGPSGPSDRRVFLALVRSCLDYGRTDTGLGSRKLALKAGLAKETVEASLKRLEAAGRLSVAKAGQFTVRRPQLSPDDHTHILPPLVRGNITSRCVCEGVDALHMVWSVPSTDKGAGLNGRHGHLFDLVCAGVNTARALGDYIGSRSDSVSRTLNRLTEVGMLVKSGSSYAPADNVAKLADCLALELGGVMVCAQRENLFREEEREWREQQDEWEKLQASWREQLSFSSDPFEINPFAWLFDSTDPFAAEPPTETEEVDPRESEQERRHFEEQQLLAQLGLPNELEP